MKIDNSKIEELRKISKDYANSAGIKLNSDENIVNGILKGLIMNKKKYGEFYCPCRRVTGNKDKDKEIICPCVFHRGEIELEGSCHCNLFTS